jgi:hypothetical protein
MKIVSRAVIDEDVIRSLAAALSRLHHGPRVDTSTMLPPLGAVAAQLEQRAEPVVRRVMNYIPKTRRCQPYIFFCEDEQYGAFHWILAFLKSCRVEPTRMARLPLGRTSNYRHSIKMLISFARSARSAGCIGRAALPVA